MPAGTFEAGSIEGHTSPCPMAALPSDSEAKQMMLEHLLERGYDRSGLVRLQADNQP